MKFKILIILISLIFLEGCKNYEKNNLSSINLEPQFKYRNIGFSLIYNDNLDIKNLDNRSLKIFHKNLKKNSLVKIANPLNNKSLIAEVKSNRVKFSNFYNSVITDRIAEELELDYSEPYIEIILISKNSTFVAKKAKTFDEEKKVAEKAPIDGIKISNLNSNSSTLLSIKSNEIFSYSIKVADFYYKKTANLMINRIKSETSIKNIRLIEMSKTNYRVLLGPFNDIKSLKETFEKMNSLYFENLEIIKNA
tara:strand:+ start:1025 stop:1777 length:753 start_codon:yes stop_codon:yes gene_type:complete